MESNTPLEEYTIGTLRQEIQPTEAHFLQVCMQYLLRSPHDPPFYLCLLNLGLSHFTGAAMQRQNAVFRGEFRPPTLMSLRLCDRVIPELV